MGGGEGGGEGGSEGGGDIDGIKGGKGGDGGGDASLMKLTISVEYPGSNTTASNSVVVDTLHAKHCGQLPHQDPYG